MNRAASQTYGMQQVMTASSAMLIAMLHDKAIVSLKEAIRAIEDGRIEERWRSNKKAVDIVTHLRSTLNHDAGGEISANLERIYDFMLARLLHVDMKNDAQSAREVIGLLEPLRDSWHQLAENGEAGQPAAAPVRTGTAAPADQRPGGTDASPAPPAGLGSFDLSA